MVVGIGGLGARGGGVGTGGERVCIEWVLRGGALEVFLLLLLLRVKSRLHL